MQAFTEVERLYRGEIAFLREVKAQRDRVQRQRRKVALQESKDRVAEKKRLAASSGFSIEGGYEAGSHYRARRNPILRMSIEGGFEVRPD